jgi:hypothetical protein
MLALAVGLVVKTRGGGSKQKLPVPVVQTSCTLDPAFLCLKPP